MDTKIQRYYFTQNYYVQVILIGDTQVGKTHLIQQFISFFIVNSLDTSKVNFQKTASQQLELNSVRKQLNLNPKQQKHKSGIWLVKKGIEAQQSRKFLSHLFKLQFLLYSHYSRALGAVFVYDITKEKTFQNLKKMIEEFKSKAVSGAVIMLLGNKLDLVETDPNVRQVTFDEAENFAIQNGMLFEEASALSNKNVSECFESFFKSSKILSYDYCQRQLASSMM